MKIIRTSVADYSPKSNYRPPDYSPWPAEGYVDVEKIMGAAGGVCISTLYRWIRIGLFPKPEKIGFKRVAWRVSDARQALEELPAKSAALRKSNR